MCFICNEYNFSFVRELELLLTLFRHLWEFTFFLSFFFFFLTFCGVYFSKSLTCVTTKILILGVKDWSRFQSDKLVQVLFDMKKLRFR